MEEGEDFPARQGKEGVRLVAKPIDADEKKETEDGDGHQSAGIYPLDVFLSFHSTRPPVP